MNYYAIKLLLPSTDDTEPATPLLIKGATESIAKLDEMTVSDGDKIEFIYVWTVREKNEETRRYRWTPQHKWQMFNNRRKIWK